MGQHYGSKVVTSSLELYLDASNVKSYPGSGTAWYDISGKGNNATLLGNSNFTTFNNVPCIDLDGIDDYVSVSNPDLLNPADASFSVEAWVSQDDLGYNGIVEARGANLHGFLIVLNYGGSGKLAAFLNSTSDTSQEIHYSTSSPWTDTETWVNATVVVNKSSDTIVFYRNGEQVGNQIGITESATLNGGSPRYWVGADLGGPEANMKINSLRHYSKALTEEEVKQNYEAYKGRFGL